MRPFFSPPPPPPPPNLHSHGFSLEQKVTPSLLLLITTIILAIIFFLSGLLHILIRFLLKRPHNTRDNPDRDHLDENVTAFEGQLQQLFHLHDAGIDQSFIDNLPVFNYKSIIGGGGGVKEEYPFDCAVCLCEFQPLDELRLLPKCSHAFHIECIDTWLLSHSTCPLCRSSLLLPDFSPNFLSSPIVLVLESGSQEISRDVIPDLGIDEFGRKGCETPASGEKVVGVKLGKLKNLLDDDDDGNGSEVESNSRRCYSMGSFAYVMDEKESLQVPIRIRTPLMKKKSNKKAKSECDCESRRDFKGFEENGIGIGIGKNTRRESFSVSKIWVRTRSNMGAFSFRSSCNDLGDDESQSHCSFT